MKSVFYSMPLANSNKICYNKEKLRKCGFMLIEQYLYKKVVDWSSLNRGINIPVSLQSLFYDNINFRMKKGDSKKITIIIEGIEYSANLSNIGFD